MSGRHPRVTTPPAPHPAAALPGRRQLYSCQLTAAVAPSTVLARGGRVGIGEETAMSDLQCAATFLVLPPAADEKGDRKSTRLNSSHVAISYAVFCLKKKNTKNRDTSKTSPL